SSDGTVTRVEETDGKTVSYLPNGTVITEETSSDPRWGGPVQYSSKVTLETPGLSSLAMSRVRSVQGLTGQSPFDFSTLSEQLTVDGATSSWQYEPATRTLTSTSVEGYLQRTVFDSSGRVSRVSRPG